MVSFCGGSGVVVQCFWWCLSLSACFGEVVQVVLVPWWWWRFSGYILVVQFWCYWCWWCGSGVAGAFPFGIVVFAGSGASSSVLAEVVVF